MSRSINLFTGQWVDLPFEEVCSLAQQWGFDGLEVPVAGDHLDVYRAAEDDAYCRAWKDTLARHDLTCYAISNHSTGQAICDDPIDFRHRGLLSDRVWGAGESDAEGVRTRAAAELKLTARVAAKLGAEVFIIYYKVYKQFPVSVSF